MIKKLRILKNLAVFKDFKWDEYVVDKDGNAAYLKPINIIFGRNYSGKTTLSRVVRSMETGLLSTKYENREFDVELNDGSMVSHINPINHTKKVRVFNEDFVRENLSFISNPDGEIKSFAILGEENNLLEEEILELESELGSKEEGNETGFYKETVDTKAVSVTAKAAYDQAQSALEQKKRNKALDRQAGIKYKPEKYGDQNYDVRKLNADIETVISDSYTLLTAIEVSTAEALLKESKKATLNALPHISFKLKDFVTPVQELIERKVEASDKIQELVKDEILRKWVDDGRKVHSSPGDTCKFCANQISKDRWSQIEKHFDEDSEKLKSELAQTLIKLTEHKTDVASVFDPDETLFYNEFHESVKGLKTQYKEESAKYIRQISSLLKQVEDRQQNLYDAGSYKEIEDCSELLESILSEYEELRIKSNNYSDSLGAKQTAAKKQLRLNTVKNFVVTVSYNDEVEKIKALKQVSDEASEELKLAKEKVQTQLGLIEDKKAQLKDKSLGAEKVNEYLNDFFGHQFLSLNAVQGDDRKFRFEIVRDGKEASHLSEGECSLVSFCYFVAKLADYETNGTKPIIWIDDPISSLDNNHIFFIYSLINTEIAKPNGYEQLTISTHNLDFLKYLMRLPKVSKDIQNGTEKKSRFFLVARNGVESKIELMPSYMKKFVTEFNYLFSQLYTCSQIEIVDQNNHESFYNFGNSARKFLEIFLYYKYPDSDSQGNKLKKFFGDETIPAILVDRVNNEYSHLSGGLERGSFPIEVPEMNSCAKAILERIKELDRDQYDSLLKSIGIELETVG